MTSIPTAKPYSVPRTRFRSHDSLRTFSAKAPRIAVIQPARCVTFPAPIDRVLTMQQAGKVPSAEQGMLAA
jgi:hypothetical protein